jgi:hypothetical protein
MQLKGIVKEAKGILEQTKKIKGISKIDKAEIKLRLKDL